MTARKRTESHESTSPGQNTRAQRHSADIRDACIFAIVRKDPPRSGWAFGIDLPPIGATKVVDGKVIRATVDQSARHSISNDVPGALPWTKAPTYKPEFQEKVKHLEANESKLDGVFYCGRPRVPRIGSPRKSVELPHETIFLDEDIS